MKPNHLLVGGSNGLCIFFFKDGLMRMQLKNRLLNGFEAIMLNRQACANFLGKVLVANRRKRSIFFFFTDATILK